MGLAIKTLGNNLHLFVTWDIDLTACPVTLNGTYQPLSAFNENPPRRMPVGAALTGNNIVVDDMASFDSPITGTFDGMANPISGSRLGSQIHLVGTIRSTDLVCGTVTGTICLGTNAPCQPGVSVQPATFAAVRVANVNTLPALPPMDACPP